MRIIELFEARAKYPLPIRPSSDNIENVLSSNFSNGRVFGNEIVPVDSLNGSMSAAAGDAEHARRLAAHMSGTGGYVSRLLVDPDGNVIEGQHRLTALRQLGHTHVPITRVGEATHGFPEQAMIAAVRAAVPTLHRDQVSQMVGYAADAIREAGSAQAALEEFEHPRGFEAAWVAALQAVG